MSKSAANLQQIVTSLNEPLQSSQLEQKSFMILITEAPSVVVIVIDDDVIEQQETSAAAEARSTTTTRSPIDKGLGVERV